LSGRRDDAGEDRGCLNVEGAAATFGKEIRSTIRPRDWRMKGDLETQCAKQTVDVELPPRGVMLPRLSLLKAAAQVIVLIWENLVPGTTH
jgi:hypothetical protein